MISVKLATNIHRVSGQCSKRFKVSCQRSRLQWHQMHFSGRGKHSDSVGSGHTCYLGWISKK